MNPLIQSKQTTTPVFVVALLLVGFAITQSAMGGEIGGPEPIRLIPQNPPRPNHPDFRVTIDKVIPLHARAAIACD